MAWDQIEAFVRHLLSPMPGAQIPILSVAVALVASALIAIWRGWWHGLQGWLSAALTATVGAILIATLALRIGDRPPPGSSGEVILTPLLGLWRTAGPHATGDDLANFYGNIALFVPLGMLLAWLLNGRLAKRVAFAWLLGATLSVSIELTQSTMDRTADINDIILNSAGTALGACLGYGVLMAARAVKSDGPS